MSGIEGIRAKRSSSRGIRASTVDRSSSPGIRASAVVDRSSWRIASCRGGRNDRRSGDTASGIHATSVVADRSGTATGIYFVRRRLLVFLHYFAYVYAEDSELDQCDSRMELTNT